MPRRDTALLLGKWLWLLFWLIVPLLGLVIASISQTIYLYQTAAVFRKYSQEEA